MRILLLADIHIGSIKDIPYFYKTITDIIEKEVMLGKVDLVVILGDYFDKLFKNNDDYTALAINIMTFLIQACIRRNAKIRIIYGTESHEMNQYKLFNYHLMAQDVDFKIYDTVTEEKINGEDILFIPEEYIDNKFKHYKKYLYSKKKYSFIFGHGIIEDGMPSIVSYSADNTNNLEKQVPRFKSGELADTSDICVFGHYHTYTDMGNDVYYLGSLFRDSFGEEEAKGYGIIDKVDDKYQFTFVENKDAYVYKTYEFDIDSSVFKDSDHIITEIQRIKDENAELFDGTRSGKIRLKFNVPDTVDPTFKENLKSVLFNEKNFASIIKENNINEVTADDIEDENDEYSFILDPSIQLIDKIFRYMSLQFDDPMTLDELKEYLGESLQLIKESYEREIKVA